MGDKNPLLDEEVFTIRRKRMVEEQIASRGIRRALKYGIPK